MRTRFETCDTFGSVLVVEHPDGGCTAIAEKDDMHAVFQLSAWERQQMRYSAANRAGATRRSPRPTTPEGES